jgi:hypothetical protein
VRVDHGPNCGRQSPEDFAFCAALLARGHRRARFIARRDQLSNLASTSVCEGGPLTVYDLSGEPIDPSAEAERQRWRSTPMRSESHARLVTSSSHDFVGSSTTVGRARAVRSDHMNRAVVRR